MKRSGLIAILVIAAFGLILTPTAATAQGTGAIVGTVVGVGAVALVDEGAPVHDQGCAHPLRRAGESRQRDNPSSDGPFDLPT